MTVDTMIEEPSDSLAAHVLLTLSIILAISYVMYRLKDLRHQVPNEPPMVRSFVPVLHSAIAFRSNPYEFLSSCRSKLGEVFSVRLGPKHVTFICDPRSYSGVFRNKSLSFQMVADEISKDVFRQSKSMVADQDMNRAVHQQFTRHLAGEGLQEFTIRSYVTIRDWMREDRKQLASTSSQQRGLYQLINDLVFDAGVAALFGKMDTANLKNLFQIFDKEFPLLVGKAPSFLTGKSAAALSELIVRFSTWDEKVEESTLVAARRRVFKECSTVDDNGACQFSLLWAGVGNTIPAAFWTIAYLVKNPVSLAAVRAELDEHLPYIALDEGDDEPWTREQCSKLKLTSSAMNEALRLATGSMVIRTALEDTSITLHDGEPVGIRKGSSVAVFPALTHFDSRIFANPQEYVVDRFTSGQPFELNGTKVPSAFMAFGSGVSQCPGRFWAQNEVLMMVALLLQHCEITADTPLPSFDYSRVGIGVFPPKGEMPIQFKYRKEV